MEGFVPIAVAAREAGYSYAAVYQLHRRERVKSRQIYGRPYVDLAEVLAYKAQMNTLGTAKHAPRRAQLAAQEPADA